MLHELTNGDTEMKNPTKIVLGTEFLIFHRAI